MLLDWGPHFENHCSNLSCFETHPLLANLKMQTDSWILDTPSLQVSIYVPRPKVYFLQPPGTLFMYTLPEHPPNTYLPTPLSQTLPTCLGKPLFSHHAQLICLVFWLPSLNSSMNGISSYFTLLYITWLPDCGFWAWTILVWILFLPLPEVCDLGEVAWILWALICHLQNQVVKTKWKNVYKRA